MFQYDNEEENIILCINCDAEYTITKIDNEEEDPEFCPFCGYHQVQEDEDDDIDDEEDDRYLN